MIWNKQNKHNSLIASSGPAPVGLSVDYTKQHDSGAEVSHEASFMKFDLKNTSQFWSSLEDVSSSNRRVKLWSTFLKEDIKFLFEEMLFGMFALNLAILLNSGFLGLSLKGYRNLCLVHCQVSDGAERSLSSCGWCLTFSTGPGAPLDIWTSRRRISGIAEPHRVLLWSVFRCWEMFLWACSIIEAFLNEKLDKLSYSA